jgi:hypothetical protein
LRAIIASPLGYHLTNLTIGRAGGQPRDVHAAVDSEYQAMLHELSRLTWVQELTLEFDEWTEMREELDLTSLLQLRCLESLEIVDSPLSLKQLGIIKQLPSLWAFERTRCDYSEEEDDVEFNTYPWTVEELRALLTPPHQLQRLKYLPFNAESDLTPAHMESLVHVPQLERLDPYRLTIDCLPYLHHFTNLRYLELFLAGGSGSALTDASHLLPHLAAFGSLESLQLRQFDLSAHATHFGTIIVAMPRLSTLILDGVRLTTLTALASAPSLTDLTLSDCMWITFVELCQLSPCVTLRHLRISLSIDDDEDGDESSCCLTATQQRALRVPSSRLPGLETFEYSCQFPAHDGDDDRMSDVEMGPEGYGGWEDDDYYAFYDAHADDWDGTDAYDEGME